jgi:hypothetical protein
MLALLLVLPVQAGAVKSESLDAAEARLAQAVAANDPRGFMQAVHMARLAIDAPRDKTLFLEARATYALAWMYFLNAEAERSAAQAQVALGVLNQAFDARPADVLALQAYRVMIAALLRANGGVFDPLLQQQAEDDLRMLVESGGDAPLVLYARAIAALHASDLGRKTGSALDEAAALFARLLSREPHNRVFRAFTVFCKAKADDGERPAAAQVLSEMLRVDPGFRLATFLRGRL